MVRLIMSEKGAGKTKQLIELVNAAAAADSGSIVCIEASSALTFDLNYQVRLVAADEYQLTSYERMRGFISGLYAGNYDISHVFIDNLFKIVNGDCNLETENFLDWLNTFSNKHGVKFTVAVSEKAEHATDGMQKYL